MSVFSWLLIFAGLFIATMLVIGYVGYKQTQKNIADYFIARGQIGLVPLFFTSYATLMSAWTFIGLAGSGYRNGLGWSIVPAIEGLAWAAGIYYLGFRMWVLAQRHDYVTPTDYLADRFKSEWLRLIVALVILIGLVPQVAIQVTGFGTIFEGLSEGKVSYIAATVVFLFVLALYTIAGGFRAVAWTDTVQGIMLFVFLWVAFIAIMGQPEVGGIKGALAAANGSLALLPGGGEFFDYRNWLAWILLLTTGVMAYPQLTNRFFAAKNPLVLKKTAQLMPVLTTTTYFPTVLVGMAAVAAGMNLSNPDDVMPSMLVAYTAPALAAIVGIAAIAAALSTVDSILLTVGSVVARDIVQKFLRISDDQKVLVIWSRYIIGAWVLLCFALGLWRPTVIVLMSGFALRFIGIGLFFPLLAALFWPRATTAGVLGSVILGEIVGVLTMFVWSAPFGWDAIFWGLGASLLSLVIISYLTPAPGPEIVKKFYDDVEEDLELVKRSNFELPGQVGM